MSLNRLVRVDLLRTAFALFVVTYWLFDVYSISPSLLLFFFWQQPFSCLIFIDILHQALLVIDVTFYKLNNIWIKGNELKISTKIKLYKSLVKSILLYNCGAWVLTLTGEERFNAYHRKQLKRVLKIRYPKKRTNCFKESAKKSHCH